MEDGGTKGAHHPQCKTFGCKGVEKEESGSWSTFPLTSLTGAEFPQTEKKKKKKERKQHEFHFPFKLAPTLALGTCGVTPQGLCGPRGKRITDTVWLPSHQPGLLALSKGPHLSPPCPPDPLPSSNDTIPTLTVGVDVGLPPGISAY